jgi:selenocysteine lyase/cysteine desulfurase
VIAVSHVLTLPVAVADVARARGVRTIVDGAQAFGTLVNATALGVDVYVASAHKWLLAPTGNGIACIRESFVNWVQVTALDSGLGMYTRTIGTRSAFPTLDMGHSLNYIDGFGRQQVVNYNAQLAHEAWTQLSMLGLSMLAPAPQVGDAPIYNVHI